eukprot:g42814.t1
MVWCLPDARVKDISDRLERILEREREDPVVAVHIRTNNIGKTRKEDLWCGKEGFLFMGHWHQYWNRRDLYHWDGLHLNRAETNVLVKR